jgi:small subunit ribosomal protein S13
LDKEEKENKEMPEDPVDKPTGEEKIQDKAEEAVEEKKEEAQRDEPIKEKQETKPSEDKAKDKETEEKVEAKSEKEPIAKKEEKPVDKTSDVADKKAKKSEEKQKKTKHSDDFKYIVRLSNTDIDGEKNVIFGLTSIKGIGMAMASLIIRETKINQKTKMGDLKDSQIEILQSAINDLNNTAPKWMLNHRKDYETGKDIHLIGPDIDMRLRDEINIMKKIRSYRGIRHERRLPVRGQRTRANNRTGLTLGVSKKRQKV